MLVIVTGWAKWLPFWDSASGVGDAVPTCFQHYVEVPVLGGILVLGGSLVQLLGTRKPEPTSGGDAPAEVPSASGSKFQCALLLCMAPWEAILNNKEVPCNNVSSSKLTCLDLQVDVTRCNQVLPAK